MKTVLLATAVTSLTSALLLPAGADAAKLPPKFVGHWCGSSNQGPGLTRGHCDRNRAGDGYMVVNANGFEGHEESCKVLSVAPKSGNYLAKFKCHIEGDTSTVTYRMSLDNKGRLIMR